MDPVETPDMETTPVCAHVSPTYAYLVALVSIVVFTVVNVLAQVIGPPQTVDGDIWRWRNTLVSWVHGLIVGGGCLYCLFFKPEVFEDLLTYCDRFIYSLLAFSFGYFVYDLGDFVIYNRAFRSVDILIHHFAVIGSFWYHLHNHLLLSFTIFALTVEVNSIFLHARKLLQFQKWPLDHWLYKAVVILNLLTFIRYRLYTLYFISLSIPRIWEFLPSDLYRICITVAIGLMDIIHVVLFWRLVKNDVFRNYKVSKPDRTSKPYIKPGSNGVNNNTHTH